MENTDKKQIVLMYHGIISPDVASPEGREVGAELYDVTLNDFSRQIRWLKDHDYRAVSLSSKKTSLNDKEVVITFDDGELNNSINALPVLKEHGFKAYFFIISKRVGNPDYMDWDELRQLHNAGMVIGSHGLSHEILTNLLDTQIEEELIASKRFLETNLNITVESLSIPRGFCDDKVIQMAYAAGYKTIFISDRPKSLQEPCLSRIAVKGGWSLKRFEQAVLDQVPFTELIINGLKKGAKLVLRESGYNRLRSTLIKVFK